MPATLVKKTLVQVFSCEFCEISKNNFFTEHLWATASIALFWIFRDRFSINVEDRRELVKYTI